jgi:glycosyltransferase involved in cell wall biosynthesis
LLDALFPDSLRGADHVARLYPWFAGKTFASRQGVDDPGFITSVSSDGVFRVVSCAAIIARKRLDLTLRGVALAARSSPRTTFEWNHIGDGPLRGEIEAMAKKELPANVVMHILGYLPPEQMMEFYRDNAIDVFITTTESEGTPVSLMEAAACGMAVVATDVGGNPEVVSERNGVVLDAKPSPTAVAAALLQVLKDPIAAAAKRQESRRVWQERYDAKRNYMEFAERIKAIPAPRGVAPAKPDRSAECGLKSEG